MNVQVLIVKSGKLKSNLISPAPTRIVRKAHEICELNAFHEWMNLIDYLNFKDPSCLVSVFQQQKQQINLLAWNGLLKSKARRVK